MSISSTLSALSLAAALVLGGTSTGLAAAPEAAPRAGAGTTSLPTPAAPKGHSKKSGKATKGKKAKKGKHKSKKTAKAPKAAKHPKAKKVPAPASTTKPSKKHPAPAPASDDSGN